MDIRYPATVEAQKDGTFLVQFVDLPDTFTEGLTKEEALFNAAEVLSAMLAWRLDHSKEVPAPSQKVRGAHYVAPDAKTQALLSARRRTHLRAISGLTYSGGVPGLERVLWDAKEGKHPALQLGQLQVEDLDGAPVLEQMVALGQTEQAQHLLGGGVRALALLGVDG